MSKQAVSQQIAHLERNGDVRVDPGPHDRRARLLALTPTGRRAQTLAKGLFADIERDWAVRLGDDDMGRLRDLLETLNAAVRADPGCC